MKFKQITAVSAFVIGAHFISTAQIASEVITIAPEVTIEISNSRKAIKEGEILVLKAKGSDERSAYQWQMSTDNKTWTNIPKATGNVFETFPIVQNTYFRVVCKPIDADATLVETISNVESVTLETQVATTRKKND